MARKDLSPTTVEALAAELFLDPADIKYTISEHFALDLHYDEIEADVAQAVRLVLDRHGARTMDDLYWPWPYKGPVEPVNPIGSY